MSLKRIAIYGLTALALVSCESQSEIDTNFLGSASGPFTSQFTFANSSQYNFDSSKIDFTNGYAELTSSSQTDSSNIANGFAGGSSTGTAWDSTNSYLRLDHSGLATDLELDASWTPAWSSLVGYWKLDEPANTGIAVDSSAHASNQGVVNGGVTQGVPGKLNSGATFDGSSGYIAVNDDASLRFGSSDFSISAWLKSSTTSTSVAVGKYGGSGDDYWMGFNDRGQAEFSVSGTGISSLNAYNDGGWHHIVGVQASDISYLYVDGVFQGSTPAAVTASPGGYFGIGKFGSASTFYWPGSIDDVAVWNTSLSSTAIATIYQHEVSKYAGIFTSRVIDGFSNAANWTNFSWIPTLPFFKELPDSTNPLSPVSETQANYSSQTANLMSGIVGLWHFDEAYWTGTAGEVKDKSGNGNNGYATNGANTVSNAKFGNVAYFNNNPSSNNQNVTLPVSLNPWAGDFSLSFWGNTISSSGSEQHALVQEVYNTNGFRFGTNGLSASNQDWTFWTDESGGTIFCQAAPVIWGQWTHLLATYNHLTGALALYVNGVPTYCSGGTYIFPSGGLSVGAGDGQFFNGYMDELAIWSRVLSPAEAIELYRRGANRIKYQTRICADLTCSANPTWQGPDNTDQSYFSELNNNAIQNDGGDLSGSDSVQAGLPNILFSNFLNLMVPTNRYFQYRAIMESDDTSTNCNYGSGATWCSPELKSVNVGPGHYDTTSPTVSNKIGVSYATLTNLIESLGTSGCSSGTLYNLSPDNLHWYYWTGAAWGLAGGASTTANSATTITSHLATFATQLGVGSIYFKVFLQSSGTSACAIDNLEVDGTQ